MELEDVLDLLVYLEERQKERRLYLRWIVGPQFEVSFDEFKRQLTPVRVRSDEEILAEVYKLFEGVSP